MSCRQAAERFGVGASNAIRWQQQVRTTGTIEPRTQGGDRRSKRIEAYSQVDTSINPTFPPMKH